MEKHGLVATNREKHAAKGGIEREALEALIEAGMTIAEIAGACGLSKSTVRHWMRRYGSDAEFGWAENEVGRAAKEAGLLTAMMACAHHGETEFTLEGRAITGASSCRSGDVTRHRRKLKSILVREAGGRCVVCRYDRHLGALQFHHLDLEEKRLTISRNGVTLSLDVLRAEAGKCVMLCSNCHAEVEGGVISLP